MSAFNLSALAVRERAVTLFFIICSSPPASIAFVKLGRAEDPSFTIKTLTVTPSGPARPRRRCRTWSPSRWRSGFRS